MKLNENVRHYYVNLTCTAGSIYTIEAGWHNKEKADTSESSNVKEVAQILLEEHYNKVICIFVISIYRCFIFLAIALIDTL